MPALALGLGLASEQQLLSRGGRQGGSVSGSRGWGGKQGSSQPLVLREKSMAQWPAEAGLVVSWSLEGAGPGPQPSTGLLSPGSPRRALFWGHFCPDAQTALCGRRAPARAWCPHSCASRCLGYAPQWAGKGPLQARGHHLGPGGTGHQGALCPWLEAAGSLPLHQLQPLSQWEQLAPPSPNPQAQPSGAPGSGLIR